MTFQYTTVSGNSGFVHDVISVLRVGTHTYEFTQHGRTGKLRITEIQILKCDVRCLCHAARD